MLKVIALAALLIGTAPPAFSQIPEAAQRSTG